MFQLLTTLTFAVMAVSGSTAFVTRRQSEGPSGGPPPPGIRAGSPPFLPPTELSPLHVVECAHPTTMENFDKTKVFYYIDWCVATRSLKFLKINSEEISISLSQLTLWI